MILSATLSRIGAGDERGRMLSVFSLAELKLDFVSLNKTLFRENNGQTELDLHRLEKS